VVTLSLVVSPFPASAPSQRMSYPPCAEADLSAALIRSAQAGDEAAFSSIIRSCKGRLLAMASRYVQSASELDDLAQEIFVHLWKGLGSFRFDAPFPHWVSRVAVNACLTHLKKQKRRNRLFTFIDEADELDRLAHATSAPEAETTARDAADRLLPALKALRAEERLVITLVHLEEKSVAEVAALTGWSESNVKVRAMRARRKLKEHLDRHEATL
jgi:RNA polymerase sigma-70 factor, ECF subfamily